MGEKDSPLDGLIDGKQRIITFYDVTDGKKIDDRIIADSLVTERECELLDAQKKSFPIKIIPKSLHNSNIGANFADIKADRYRQ